MNRRIKKRGVFCLLLTLLLAAALTLPLSAEKADERTAKTLPDEFSNLLDTLPDSIRDLVPEGIFSEGTEDVHGAVADMSNFSYLLKTVLSLLGVKIGDCLRLLSTVAGLLILSALCRTLQISLRSSSVARAFSLCTTWVMLILLLGKGYAGIERVVEYFSTLSTVTATSVPLLGALYAMGGNVSTAVASSAGLSVFMTLLETLIGKTVVPFCGVCLAFSLVGALDPAMRIGTLLSTIKKNYTTALTFLMMLLLTMISSQTLLAARADTLAMKSAKFAAGNLIPVLGGSVSELLRSVCAGVGYLRGTVGICVLLLLLLLLLPPVIELLLLRLTWQICASLADLLGCDTEKRLLEEFSSVGGYLIAAMCICSSVLFLSFTLLTHCAAALA